MVAGGLLALDGLELADEIGHLLGAERGRYGAMTAQRLGRVEVRIRRLPSGPLHLVAMSVEELGSATGRYKRRHGPTVEQLNAIDHLVHGATDQETAEAVGVHRVTVTRWRNYDVVFQAELNRRRREVWQVSTDRLRALLP